VIEKRLDRARYQLRVCVCVCVGGSGKMFSGSRGDEPKTWFAKAKVGCRGD
jgi:hypothetical protein